MITLWSAPAGTEQTIQEVNGDEKTKALARSIGLIPGAKVRIISAYEGGVVIISEDMRTALSRQIAEQIRI